MNSRIHAWTSPLTLLLLLAGCGGSSGGGSGSGSTLPELRGIVNHSSLRLAYTLTASDSYPLVIDSLVINHAGEDGRIVFSFADDGGVVRTVPTTGVLKPGDSATVSIQALGLSYSTSKLKLTCVYDDRNSQDKYDVPFDLVFNGGTFPGPALDTVLKVTEPTVTRLLMTPVLSYPRQIDSFQLTYDATEGLPVRVSVTDPLGNLRASGSGLLQPGESRKILIECTRAEFGIGLLTLTAEYDLRGPQDEFERQWRIQNVSPPNLAGRLVTDALTGGNPAARQAFWEGLTLDVVGVEVEHPTGPPRNKVPVEGFTEVGVVGTCSLSLLAAELGAAFWKSKTERGPTPGDALFPPGSGRYGYTIHPQREVDMNPGAYHVFHLTAEKSIPQIDPEPKNEHLYTFAIDADLQPGNNWQAPPTLPRAPYQGTDRWYEVRYSTAVGWTLVVSQVDASNGIAEVDSAARAVVSDNAVYLLVPISEFGPVLPAWRAVTFVHQGDQGLQPPFTWSGDVVPAVGSGLLSFK